MRSIVISASALALWAASAGAQTAAPAPHTFASAAEVAGAIEAAAAKQGNLRLAPLLSLAPFQANVEYRTGDASAGMHEHEAELFVVLDGAGTYTSGGTIAAEAAADGTSYKRITGGTARRVAKGDTFLVPPNTPHQFTAIRGRLVMVSMHLPQPPAP